MRAWRVVLVVGLVALPVEPEELPALERPAAQIAAQEFVAARQPLALERFALLSSQPLVPLASS